MSKSESNPRVYVERNIYYRRNAKGQKVYEMAWPIPVKAATSSSSRGGRRGSCVIPSEVTVRP
jgi:hypothetical protein